MVLHEQLHPVGPAGRSAVGEKSRNGVRGEGGFTLIELMFAMVYLTVGMLAIAGMEDLAIARAVDAKRQTYAVNMASEMIERIRFNAPANSTLYVGNYPYNGIKACSDLTSCTGGETAGNTTATPTSSGDYDQWRAHLKATDPAGQLLLPNAVGTVTSTATGSTSMGQVLITVTITYGSLPSTTFGSTITSHTVTMNFFVAPL